MKEYYYEKRLNIQTSGDQRGFNNIQHYHRYESTPYHVLDVLFENYQLSSKDRLVDFGCGKGRVDFYVHYHFQTEVIGVEMNKSYFDEAIKNLYRYMDVYKGKDCTIYFTCCKAENYEVSRNDNCFYFFNPFSIQIFMKVINNILLSVEKYERTVDLIIYYGSDDYLYYLDYQTSFDLIKEIEIPGLIEKDSYEKFHIYRLGI